MPLGLHLYYCLCLEFSTPSQPLGLNRNITHTQPPFPQHARDSFSFVALTPMCSYRFISLLWAESVPSLPCARIHIPSPGPGTSWDGCPDENIVKDRYAAGWRLPHFLNSFSPVQAPPTLAAGTLGEGRVPGRGPLETNHALTHRHIPEAWVLSVKARWQWRTILIWVPGKNLRG